MRRRLDAAVRQVLGDGAVLRAAQRDALVVELWNRRVIMLASGPDSVRFRPALIVSRAEIDAAIETVRAVLTELG